MGENTATMSMELTNKLTLRQGFALSPEMRRSFEIMQVPSWKLSELISKELAENPTLEFPLPNEKVSIEDFSSKKSKDKKESSETGDFESENDSRTREIKDGEEKPAFIENSDSFSPFHNSEAQKRRDFFFDSLPSRESPHEKLLSEARLNAPDEQSFDAFEFLLGLLDSRGFLPNDALAQAEQNGFSEKSATNAIALLQNSEPFGIGAFDMRDCLMIQLRKGGKTDRIAYRILDKYFNLLMGRKIGELAKIFNIDEVSLMDELAIIRDLNTSPGRELGEDNPEYISADLRFFETPEHTFDAELTNEHIPQLKINPEYRKMISTGTSGELSGARALKSDEMSAIREKIRGAKSLIFMIEERQNTLLKIGKSVVARQERFMRNGMNGLQTMTMQDIADDIGVHATTVGRAVFEKYVDTPYGILPLRKFFSGGYSSGEAGNGEIASTSVKERIREIIADEPKKKPYSDAKISEILAEEKIDIKRRTVAKYRESLGIPAKSERRIF